MYMPTAPRRSSRLQILSGETDLWEQDDRSRQHNLPAFLKVSVEVRQIIFSYLVKNSDRPFLIGRCQEDHPPGTKGISPRDRRSDCFKMKSSPHRDESRSRPVQPPITRVCRVFREEALPLWYSKNSFWLIHNEYEPPGEVGPKVPSHIDAWMSQTRRDMFDYMEHISLCGYTQDWLPEERLPISDAARHTHIRTIITLNLKGKKITQWKYYSTYGDQISVPLNIVESAEGAVQSISSEAEAEGLAVLKAVLKVVEGLFRIPYASGRVRSCPNLGYKELATGWEFDW